MASSTDTASNAMLIKFTNGPGSGLIPFSQEDFAVVEDVRDLLPYLYDYDETPDFVFVCRDEQFSSYQWYGLRVHKDAVLERCSRSMRQQIEPQKSAAGYYLGIQHIAVVQTIVRSLYLEELVYEPECLPFGEAYFLVSLYRIAVHKGLCALSDHTFTRLTTNDIKIVDAEELKLILKMTFFSSIGCRANRYKRGAELRAAVIQKYWEVIRNELTEEDVLQWCCDSEIFADLFLNHVACGVMLLMGRQGLELEEVD